MKTNFTTLKVFFTFLLVTLFTHSNAQNFTTNNLNEAILTQGIVFYNDTEGYMCGDNGAIFKINTDRSTTKINTPVTDDLWRIAIIPNTQGQGFVAVGDNGAMLKSTDGGQTITQLTSPQATGSFLFGIQCIDENIYYACGGDFATTSGTVLKTTDGGATWKITPLNGILFLDNVYFINKDIGFTVGGSSTSGVAYRTLDGGENWEVILLGSGLLIDVYAFSENAAVIVGVNGQIYKTFDAGQNWFTPNVGSNDYFGVEFFDDFVGYIAGGSGQTILLKTTNGGIDWFEVPTSAASGNFWNIGISPKRIVATASNGDWVISDAPTLSVQNTAAQKVNIYPNPTTDKITIELNTTENYTAILYTVEGKTIIEKNISQANNTISVSHLAKGIYLLQMQNSKGVKQTQKLIVN
jgi:photosystem II stability/assembly factor-like uncharacterized protein